MNAIISEDLKVGKWYHSLVHLLQKRHGDHLCSMFNCCGEMQSERLAKKYKLRLQEFLLNFD